ncbi:hypothetical protein CHARACLAT_010114 [Characodon lateralis]|uniref:Uncharacterized protein n=1 Tax=Characodon lateralis TaxID=208331 RepID=A0ABU7DZV6_9TELE|nr:hypothetical protein [Characodon lateralis]
MELLERSGYSRLCRTEEMSAYCRRWMMVCWRSASAKHAVLEGGQAVSRWCSLSRKQEKKGDSWPEIARRSSNELSKTQRTGAWNPGHNHQKNTNM